MFSDRNSKPSTPRNQQSHSGASDVVRDRFLANICHELRTPINGVIGMLDLLNDSALDGDQRMYAATAQRSAEHLLSLIDELLDLSLLESGTLALQEVAFDLRHTLDSVTHAHTELARQHGSTLNILCPIPSGTRVIGDSARLGQLVSSLLDSVLKKNPNIGIDLALDATVEGRGYWSVQLSLSNPAGPLQCDGDGLSWRFAQSLAEHLGTRIELDEGYGYTTLRLSLTLAAAPDTLAGMRFLFVEDDSERRAFLESGLADHGIRAAGYGAATDALSALKQAALDHDPFHVVMLGRRMQGIDGELLGRAIMADSACSSVRHVLLSSDGVADANKLAAAGFTAVIDKSASAAELVAALRQATEAAADDANVQSALTTPRTFAGSRVLIADDHVVNQQIAARMLVKFGCEIDIAIDGREAVDKHEAQQYDLIIMDCQMPLLDGYQATARIRALETGRKRTPIVGWTAFALQEERQRCLGAGMDDFMTKPLRPRPLHDMLAKWLGRSAKATATAMTHADDEFESMQEIFGADFPDLARLFLADSPKRIDTLRSAIEQADSTLLTRIAHAFSGSTASIGANGLSVLCKSLEADARAGVLAEAEAKLAAITGEYAKVEAKLRSMIAPAARPQ